MKRSSCVLEDDEIRREGRRIPGSAASPPRLSSRKVCSSWRTPDQSYQAALETSQRGHGYLTFSLVEEGLKKGMADLGQRDGQVLVRE